jgi:3-oxoadipate enol-lactonase
MPFLQLPHGQLHYALTGEPSAPVLVLSNSLGTNFSMWDAQLPAFARQFQILRYDTRGHGQSAVPPGPYDFAQLGGDVLALLDALHIAAANFCGLSMGGMTGLWLALHAPDRFHKLVVSSASAKFGTADSWNARIAAVNQGGMPAVAAQVVQRWFTPEFQASAPDAVRATLHLLENTPPHGYAACCAALRDSDLREEISAIRTPTLVLSGDKDPVSPPADGKFLAETIPGAQFAEVPGAHLANIESPAAYTSAVLNFLGNSQGA